MRFALSTFVIRLVILAAAVPQPARQRTGTGHAAIPLFPSSNLVNSDETINLDAASSHIVSVNAKLLCGFENYETNTGMKHPLAINGLRKRDNGIPLSEVDVRYGTIRVGTPPKDFKVTFDTGSSAFFLPASTCLSCAGHSLWDPTTSSTAYDMVEQFELIFEDGDIVTGDFYFDNISISDFTVSTQIIGAASTYSELLQYPVFFPDGLMGLAFRSLSRYNIPSLIETLYLDGQLEYPVVSFKLSSPGAELYIGGSNSALYKGDFTYVPVMVPAYWQVTMDNIQGDDKIILSNVDVIIDTATIFIFGTPSQVDILHRAFDGGPAPSNIGTDYFTFPCDSFPTISFTFGGTAFPIPPAALNAGRVSPDSPQCISNIIGDSTISFWVIGITFLQYVYTTFDIGKSMVGFALLQEEPQAIV